MQKKRVDNHVAAISISAFVFHNTYANRYFIKFVDSLALNIFKFSLEARDPICDSCKSFSKTLVAVIPPAVSKALRSGFGVCFNNC